MRRVGELLRLHRETSGLAVDHSAMLGEFTEQLVTGANLDAEMTGVDFQHPSAGRIMHPDGGVVHRQHETMVVAEPVENLPTGLADPPPAPVGRNRMGEAAAGDAWAKSWRRRVQLASSPPDISAPAMAGGGEPSEFSASGSQQEVE